MDNNQLRNLANQLGINILNYTSDNRKLVQLIQQNQGKEPCYMTDKRYSCNRQCEWGKSCKKLTASWLR